MTKIIGGLVLAVLGFLAGFVPQYNRASGLDTKNSELTKSLGDERQARSLSDFRNRSARLYFELSKSNFDTAGEQASQFFTDLRQFTNQTSEPMRQRLEKVLSSRDTVVARIAKADPASASLLQSIFSELQGI